MNILKWLPFAEKVGRFLKLAPNYLLLGLGSSTLVAAILFAAVVAGKELAVAIATSGTFVGTALLSLAIPKLVYLAMAEQIKRQLSETQGKERLHEVERQQQACERKLLEAEKEIARLESMQIHVEALQPIMTLGLLKVETKLTDFKWQWVGEEQDPWLGKARQDAYVGAVRIPVNAQLGIDLQQVRISEQDGGGLLVSGMTMTTVADTADGAEWLLDEVATVYRKNGNQVEFGGVFSDPRAKALSREHEHQVRNRLKAGQDFQVFEGGLIRAAEHVLRALLAPLGKKIRFQKEPQNEGQDLLRYLGDHNHSLKTQIEDLKEADSRQPLRDSNGTATEQ